MVREPSNGVTEEGDNNSKAPRNRNAFRFGMSTLLMVMTLVATFIAAETNRMHHRRIVEEAFFSDSVKCSPRFESPILASCLTKLFGQRCDEVITSVSINKDEMNDRAFDSLTRLRHVRTLGFWKIDLSDSQLDRLAKMKSLQWLYFLNSNVEQAKIDSLRKEMPNCYVNCVDYP